MEDRNLLFEHPVFVCGASRSGTTLFMNLLDGHPDLMVFPVELHVLEYFRKRKLYPTNFFKTDFLKAGHQSFYCDPVSIEEHNKYVLKNFGPDLDFNMGNHDWAKFKSVYLESLKDGKTLKDIISSWAKAFYHANKPGWPDYEPLYFVDKRPLETEICAMELYREFPKAKFIHIIRDPRGRFASAKKRFIFPFLPTRIVRRVFKRGAGAKISKWLEQNGPKYMNYREKPDFVTALCASSILSMKLSISNEKKIGKENYLVIKYEDLINDRKKTMEEVRKFLKIKESPFLYQQTQWRTPKRALTSFYEQRSKVDENPAGRAKDNFGAISSVSERALFNFYISSTAKQFGYDIPSVTKKEVLIKIRKPFKYESVWNYILTRPGTVKIIKENKPLEALWFARWERGEAVQC